MTNAQLLAEVNAARAHLMEVCDKFEAANDRGLSFDKLARFETDLIEAEEDLRRLMLEVTHRAYAEPNGGPDRWL